MSYSSVNGQASDLVRIADRGLHYGDGLFETMAVRAGRIRLLPRHLSRLQSGCERLAIEPPPAATLLSELETAARSVGEGVVKLIVTRGAGGRGYRPGPGLATTWIVATHPAADVPPTNMAAGVRLRVCKLRLGAQPALAGMKHLNRLEQVLARSEWQDADISEGLLLDQQGLVISGTMSNVFIVAGSTVLTPMLNQCGVAGVMRAAVIDAARDAAIQVKESTITIDALLAAQEVFVTNALIGAWPVTALEQQHWPVGPITRQVQRWIGAW